MTDSVTLGQWLSAKARKNADKTAVKIDGEAIGYAELEARSGQVAAGLHKLFPEQTPVAVMMGNVLDNVVAFFGVVRAGLVEVPINPDYRGAYLQHILCASACHAVFCTEATLPNVLEVAADCPDLTTVFLTGPAPVTTGGLTVVNRDDLVAGASGCAFEDRPLDPMMPAFVMFTSGTTGPSKGAVYTHESCLNRARRVAEVSDYDADTVVFTVFPLNHMSAKCTTILAAMTVDATAIVDAKFSASRFWERCRVEGVTAFNYVGALLLMLWKQDPSPADRDHKIRIARGGGVPPALRTSFEDRFGIRILEMYGMTEFPHIAGTEWAQERRDGSFGCASPDYEVVIADSQDYQVPRGTTGELLVRPTSPNCCMSYYYRAPEASLQAFRNLWFHTGDLVTMDNDGYLYYRGRRKDAIRRRGENVSAWEVEQVVNSHEAVFESAAYAVPSDLSEDEVMVAVVAKPDADLVAIAEQCARDMPAFAVPRYWRFVSNLPKTPTHSTRKDVLRDAGITPDTWDRTSGAAAAPGMARRVAAYGA